MPNDTKRPTHLEFELFFPAEKMAAWTETDADGTERFYIGGTGSSTMLDLKGSIIKPEAQVQMLDKLTGLANKMADQNSGMTAWLNHSYKIPEDCLGAFVGASLTTRNGDGINGAKNETFIDLDIKCRLVDFSANPRAEAAYKQVKDGIRHGWSIGAYFLEIEWISDDPNSPDFWNYYVTSIDLLEVSLVGIPANQRAWVRDAESAKQYAVKCAEKIAADSRSALDRRGLVQRSILEHRSPAGAGRLALAEDFRQRSKQPHLDPENVKALSRAAESLEKLDDGSEMDPDTMREYASNAITFAAKAVGHGLCIKSATHIARCIDSLSSIVGANGGEAEPEGDEDPENEMAAQLADRNAVAVALDATIADRKSELATLEESINAKSGECDSVRTQRDAMVAAAAVAAAERDVALAALETARTESATVAEATSAAKAELAKLELAVQEFESRRLGRKSQVGDSTQPHEDMTVKPEYYKMNFAERQAALAQKAGAAPASGRDIAAAS